MILNKGLIDLKLGSESLQSDFLYITELERIFPKNIKIECNSTRVDFQNGLIDFKGDLSSNMNNYGDLFIN